MASGLSSAFFGQDVQGIVRINWLVFSVNFQASGECKYLFQNYKQGAFGVTSDDGHSTSSNGGSDMIDCQVSEIDFLWAFFVSLCF